jgi:multicomponent Na+:H+ antiporter subunit E
MITLIQNLLLAFVWMLLTGAFTLANFILGIVLGFFLLWLGQRVIIERSLWTAFKRIEFPTLWAVFSKTGQVIIFVIFFLKEIVIANIDVMLLVLSPRMSFLRPAIIELPLDVKTDEEITLLANMITLTPGTLSLDVSEDRSALYVHCVYVDDVDEKKREIKESFEQAIHEVLE